MPSFDKGPNLRTPFGKNVFLRSTQDVKTESYTVADGTVTAQTIDSVTGQKILQTGTVMAKITSGADVGKIGPFQGGIGLNERTTVTIDATGGTFTITFNGGTATAAIAFDATVDQVEDALVATAELVVGDVRVTGSTGVYTIEATGNLANQNLTDATADGGSLTGGAGTAVPVVTDGAAAAGGATDGRGDPVNIVGLNNTFLPWQLTERDVEISVVYECTAVQAWCFEYDDAGADQALTDETADLMRGSKGLDILFK